MDRASSWRDLYARMLRRHLSAPSEESLAEAYELGREAISVGIGQADIASRHHDALAALHSSAPDETSVSRAGEFLAETLASFDMLHRGFRETIARQTELNRQLRQRTLELEHAHETIARLHQEQNAFLAEASRELAGSLDPRVIAECVAKLAVPRLGSWAEVRLSRPADEQEQGAPSAITWGTPGGPPAREVELRMGPRLLGGLRLGPTKEQPPAALVEEFVSRAALALDNAAHYEEASRAIELRDEFLSVASHEMKTPLTPLLMALEVLGVAARESGDARQQKAQERALRQVQRLRRLVQELLDAARIRTGGLQLAQTRFDLRGLLREQVEVRGHEAGARPLALRLPEEPLWVEADAFRVEQVVMNLLDNALKYSPPETAVELWAARRGSRVEVSVRDRGIGVPSEDQVRVFEPWFRARNASVRHYGGLGLGLHICSEILERHGGGIRLEPAEGGGSVFTFHLPAAAPPENQG